MKPYQHVLVNRGAYSYGCDSNIVVRNLEIRVNKMEKEPDPNSNAPGLNGHISFYRVKNVTCRNLTCTDFERSQYCYHAVDFDGIVVDGFVTRGGKDGIYLNRGRNFVVRNGVLRTLDDGIAVNAGEWPGGFTPVMGFIENGLVENVVDEDGGKCNFARVITGCWKQWHPGMKLQRCATTYIFALDIPQRDVLKCAANESVYSFLTKKNKWIYYKWPRKNESVNENLR